MENIDVSWIEGFIATLQLGGLDAWLFLITGLVGVFGVIATMTTNEADNRILNVLVKLINAFAMNFGRSKNDPTIRSAPFATAAAALLALLLLGGCEGTFGQYTKTGANDPLGTLLALAMASQGGGGGAALAGLLGGGLGGPPADPVTTVAAGEAAICKKITLELAEARYGPIGSPGWTAYRGWCDGLNATPTAS